MLLKFCAVDHSSLTTSGFNNRQYLLSISCNLSLFTNIVFTFVQDFGDYLEGYYSVQTPEGEQISQLIAGYIDIILKKVTICKSA